MEKVKVKILSNLLSEGKSLRIGEEIEVTELEAMHLLGRKVAERTERPDPEPLDYREYSKGRLKQICAERKIFIPEDLERDNIIFYLEMHDYYKEKALDDLKALAKERKILFREQLKKRVLMDMLVGFDDDYRKYENEPLENLKEMAESKKLPLSDSPQEMLKDIVAYNLWMTLPDEEILRVAQDKKIKIKETDQNEDLIPKILKILEKKDES